jgi:tellurite resistance protein TerC
VNVPLWAWLAVIGVIIIMLAIDLVAHRTAHAIGLREAAAWSIFWVASGVSFGIIIWQLFGNELGQQYFAGFLMEKSLAIDNVFVWAIIFASFGVPAKYQHRVLFLGVLGALVFRGIFIAAGASLISSFGWILYVFAALLVFTGVQMLRHRNDHDDPTQSRIYRMFRRFIPMTDTFFGQRLLVRTGGVLLATPLLAVLVLIEFTDIIFAIDSIPAIFAVTGEAFLVFTANAFAILGLRALYFLLADLIHRFIFLKIGLAGILLWVGFKMALHELVKIPTIVSLAVIVVILATAITASFVATRGQGRHRVAATGAQKFRDAGPVELASVTPVFTRARRKWTRQL